MEYATYTSTAFSVLIAHVHRINDRINKVFGTSFPPPLILLSEEREGYAYEGTKDRLIIGKDFLNKGVSIPAIAHELGHRFRLLTGEMNEGNLLETALLRLTVNQALEFGVYEWKRELEQQAKTGNIKAKKELQDNRDLFKEFEGYKRRLEELARPEECAADFFAYLDGSSDKYIKELKEHKPLYSTDQNPEHPHPENRIKLLKTAQQLKLPLNTKVTYDKECNLLDAETGKYTVDNSGQLQWRSEKRQGK